MAMNGLPYYKRFPRDLIDGTIGMPFEEKVTYAFILELIYMHAGKLPDDARYISGLLGCSIRKWNGIRSALIERGKLQADLGIISNFRANLEMDNLKMFLDKQRENGSKPKQNNSLPKPSLKPKANHTDTDTDKREAKASLRATRFDEFWQAYPHRNGTKKGRASALKVYERRMRDGVSEQELIDGAQAAHRHPDVIRGYARDPTTWLNAEGWTDEIGQIVPIRPEHQHGKPTRIEQDVTAFVSGASRVR
jgi:uncharacterized protein YdaU (DUF1376 family)